MTTGPVTVVEADQATGQVTKVEEIAHIDRDFVFTGDEIRQFVTAQPHQKHLSVDHEKAREIYLNRHAGKEFKSTGTVATIRPTGTSTTAAGLVVKPPAPHRLRQPSALSAPVKPKLERPWGS